MELLNILKRRARRLKVEIYALYLAYRDPRVPSHAKVLIACVVGYAFSPIDLIPDPIPILGQLDDLVLLPLGVLAARRMIPRGVLQECRERAEAVIRHGKPVNWIAAGVISIWLAVAGATVWFVARLVRPTR